MTKFICITDLHFGNPKIDYDRLNTSFIKHFYNEVPHVDAVFLLGDTFDTSVSLGLLGTQYFIKFMIDLRELCIKHGVKLRVLRGTILHDRDQPELFTRTKVDGFDVKVISKVSVENILGMTVAYIPDNVPFTDPSDVSEEIISLNNGPVDFGICHGMFDFVMPSNMQLPKFHYVKETFKDSIHGPIFSGHIHSGGSINTEHGPIIHVPSFERFTHGDENRKGYFIVGKNEDGWKYNFIENTNAQLFFKCYVRSTELETAIVEIEKFIEKKFPDKIGALSIVTDLIDLKPVFINWFSDKYPNLIITVTRKTKEVRTTYVPDDSFTVTQDISLAPNVINLPVLISDYQDTIKNLDNRLSQDEIREILDNL